jgi:magnesium-transporting ATPase (P-type)
VGASFLAAGLVYGLPIIAAWAKVRGLIDVPGHWDSQVGLWSTVVFIPLQLLVMWKAPKPAPGSATGRAFVPAWSGIGLTTIVMLAVIFIAGARLHVPLMWQVWTSICFALWGMAWWVVAMLRPGRGWIWVAVGSLLTALANAFLIGTPDEILGCAIGILVWLGAPGLMIMLSAPKQA